MMKIMHRMAGRMALTLLLAWLLPLPADAEPKIVTNSIGMEFVLVPAGSFMMGADGNFEAAMEDELPRRRVVISKPFYLGEYEVTQAQWVAVMGTNPSHFKDRNRPVEMVSWDDAMAFVRKLNQMEKTDAYRLPTEAEWEYAARGGTETAYFFGDDPDELARYGWYKANAAGKTHPVARLEKNGFGLYDMHGNVYEFCQDWYQADYYAKGPDRDPKGPDSGVFKVARGGSFTSEPVHCRSALRYPDSPGDRDEDVGFRILMRP